MMTLGKQGDLTWVNKIPSKYLLNVDFDFKLANKIKKRSAKGLLAMKALPVRILRSHWLNQFERS
jgi:hypothetical protein